MEIGVALAALGALYTIANHEDSEKEGYRTGYHISNDYDHHSQRLPNTNTRIKNYPVERKQDLLDDPNYYANPNSSVDKMFNKINVLSATGNVVQAVTSEAEKKRANKPDPKSYLSLTGEKIGQGGFRHNNMQPFFGSTVKQRIGDYKTAETLLDNMQGAGNTHINKSSMGPLFKPQAKMHWVNGMPNISDFVQSRQNPSRNMAGVKPWQEIRVGPGLAQKDGIKGQGGFNSGMMARERWIEKTVDQLRTTTNPKVTYEGVMLGGAHYNKERGIQPKVEKNRPDRYYINGPERYFTTKSAGAVGNTARSDQPDRFVNRPGTNREYFGNGANDMAAYVAGKFEQPSKQQLPPRWTPGAANASAGGAPGMNDHGKGSFKARPNARTFTTCNEREFGNAGTTISALVAPIMDILRPSRKQNTIGTIRPTGNAGTTVAALPAWNPADKPKTTMKETTIDVPHGQGAYAGGGCGYLANVEMASDYATPQQRDDTNCYYVAGAGNTASTSNARLYNAEYNMTLNPDKQVLSQGRSPNGYMNIYNPYENIKVDKLDSDRFNGRGNFSNNTTTVTGPTKNAMGKLAMKNPINQACGRMGGEMLNAFNCNPYTQSLNSTGEIRVG